LASFLILREPQTDTLEIDSLTGVLHPTLAPYDPDGPVAVVRATRSLNSVLPQLTFVKFSLAAAPQFYNVGLAREIMEFFRANNWRGAQATMGNSSKLALLTRLAGGMGAWRGDKKFDKQRQERAERARKEKEKENEEKEEIEEKKKKEARRVATVLGREAWAKVRALFSRGALTEAAMARMMAERGEASGKASGTVSGAAGGAAAPGRPDESRAGAMTTGSLGSVADMLAAGATLQAVVTYAASLDDASAGEAKTPTKAKSEKRLESDIKKGGKASAKRNARGVVVVKPVEHKPLRKGMSMAVSGPYRLATNGH